MPHDDPKNPDSSPGPPLAASDDPTAPVTAPSALGQTHNAPIRRTSGDRRVRQRTVLAHARHRARTPLNAVLGYSEMILEDRRKGGDSGFASDVERIHKAGQQLLSRVDELLHPSNLTESGLRLDRSSFEKKVRDGLRTPLDVVIGYSEMLLDDLDEQESSPELAYRDDLSRIAAAGKQLLDIVDGLIDDATGDAERIELQLDARQGIDDLVASLKKRTADTRPLLGTVMVVDDEEANRHLLQRRLQRDGHQVILAADGHEALHMLRQAKVDLVLLDVMMSGLNGIQVLKRIKADSRLREIPVIMCSALDTSDHIGRCIEIGAEDYLFKPFNKQLLRARTRACIEKVRLRARESDHLRTIEGERQRADGLLRVIFPEFVVDELKLTGDVQAQRFEDVAVLMCDVIGFTRYCEGKSPEDVLLHLQDMVALFEQVATEHGLLKIKTIGDAFMATAGIPKTPGNPVLKCVKAGQAMVERVGTLAAGWNIRVGVHVGSVIAGVVGSRQYSYDIWGDTVNTAARVEAHGRHGAVNLSRQARNRVRFQVETESIGEVDVKGKGRLELFVVKS